MCWCSAGKCLKVFAGAWYKIDCLANSVRVFWMKYMASHLLPSIFSDSTQSGGFYQQSIQLFVATSCHCGTLPLSVSSSLSILQGLPASLEGEVVECISSSVGKMVSVQSASSNDQAVKVIEYLEILMENFSLGEAAVCCQAPIGMRM